jgi:hypothetical protein
LKNLQISENIWFKLIRDNEILLYNRYEIPSYLIGDTVFLDYESIYNYNPDIIVKNLLKEEDLPNHSHIKYRDLLLPTIFSKHDTLKIDFQFRSFALYTDDSDSSGFLMHYNLYRNNTPIELNFIKE